MPHKIAEPLPADNFQTLEITLSWGLRRDIFGAFEGEDICQLPL